MKEGPARDVPPEGSGIVGGTKTADGKEPYRWTAGGGMVILGPFPGGDFNGGANGVSNDGSIVVGYAEPAGATRLQAVRWTQGTGMGGLGDLTGGGDAGRRGRAWSAWAT